MKFIYLIIYNDEWTSHFFNTNVNKGEGLKIVENKGCELKLIKGGKCNIKSNKRKQIGKGLKILK